ncbi:FAD-dependent oxidoreductase [Enteractinococcus fodinae]|uniref:NADH dehydrogenase n=1 Tax=Enteractinococcus fodinae TaxID=684663 RepID=A0ABU2B5D1_9MICC|nr:FAD-dependent oxidoreductase [Enteractinococcus fodinae]MDR7347604.1 NADH dehydrogenase [Enteractinococcus fodinae]
MAITPHLSPKPRVLVVGGGYAGFKVAKRLQKKIRDRGGIVTVVEPNSYLTYQPFLPEVVGGSIEARHALVDLRTHLRQSEVVQGKIVEVNHAEKTATVEGPEGNTFELPYQDIVMTAGADSRTFPIDGLGEAAIGLKRIEEAVTIRNQILERIESAALMTDADERRRALTFVVVGGGFAGAELIGEIEDLVRTAISKNPRLAQSDARIVLIEAMGRIMPEVSEEQALEVVEAFRARGIEVLLNTSLGSAVDNHLKLVNMSDQSDAGSFYADTLVWTAGVAANKVAKSTDFPVEDRGRIEVTPTLQISDGEGGVLEGAWAAGDVAAVPDLTGDGPGGFCVPNAQHAGRQAERLADNLMAVRFGEGAVEEYYHKSLGAVAGMGVGKGVGNPLGIELSGVAAWFAHRAYHNYAMPTWERSARVFGGWVNELIWGKDTTQLKELETPHNAFREAAGVERLPNRMDRKASADA